MGQVIVQYKVKPEHVQANEEAVREVYAELKAKAPEGLRYGTLKLDDGVTFVHIASVETADGSNPLIATEAFRAFQAGLTERCAEPPVGTPGTLVGSYGLFD